MSKATRIPPSTTSESAGANPSRRKIVYGFANPPAPTVEPPVDLATLPDQTVRESPDVSASVAGVAAMHTQAVAASDCPPTMPEPEPREPDEYDPLWRDKLAAKIANWEAWSHRFLTRLYRHSGMTYVPEGTKAPGTVADAAAQMDGCNRGARSILDQMIRGSGATWITPAKADPQERTCS